MQHPDSAPNGPGSNRFPPYGKANMNGANMNGDGTGFSHGAFHGNQPSFGDRHLQRPNIPNINTGRMGGGNQHGHAPGSSDMQTPGTAYDMNFTPLLPSQLLLGSPFQPGSPNAFTPQFQNFSTFPNQGSVTQSQQQTQLGSPTQGHTNLSPTMYQNLMQPAAVGAGNFYGAPQSPTGGYGNLGNHTLGGYGNPLGLSPGLMSGTSRTVYLGNIPQDTTAEEILGHVRSGQIESVRLLPDKNCAFISFLDSSSATHFHSDAILKKLAIKGQDIKIGWGKPSPVPTSVALAVQQSNASRNVYLGNLSEDITEEEIREDLGKFGPIDTVKIVREKNIAFVHFLSIGNAVKAVAQLPQETKWQAPRRVFYGKDRCAYVSKTQQQNAAQYLGIAPGYAHVLNGADRDLISNALAQQSVAAAAVATSAGGVNNLGNRTVYLGNIHPETTIEEICNVVRGGLLHHIRYIPDKHICFVTFIDPTSAASFYALSNVQGLMIHNRRLKIGWGKHSGALPPAIALAVSGGASRNVYIGNLDESWTEDRLRQDFSEFGEIELVNALREKSCAFVNFTNIANAIKAIEAVRGKDEYKRFKVNFGKDRCGNPPRQMGQHNQQQQQAQMNNEEVGSPNNMLNGHHAPPPVQAQAPTPTSILNLGNNNPLLIYLQQAQQQQHQQQQTAYDANTSGHAPTFPTAGNAASFYPSNSPSPPQGTSTSSNPSHASHGPSASFSLGSSMNMGSNSMANHQHTHSHAPIQSSMAMSPQPYINGNGTANGASGATTVNGLLAPTNSGAGARGQHARAVSLPVFTQGNGQHPAATQQGPMMAGSQAGMMPMGNPFSGMTNGGYGGNHYGLAIQGDSNGAGNLPGWAEEEIGGGGMAIGVNGGM
ncbi:hypothetical protein P152DRAFT_339150 [Eremomyces bilateralis CBS 781.70]|uniref:RRM domain-containing protein n=1 Tax=Eremomyces bilateralis CBS 781.70 TaxID=1392243 RepID=A0A6G1G3E4_9PEZI|nr:uncharacterized protein P152DRAFT_339150 [Eremomyces bilateralis CBS 781.70]KAF1812451.1 hypothetical protein P152DRAFT_339150 [Eremomyces bilateralis CBS 781.70]